VLPAEDNPVSAILWNQSGKPICAYTLIWKYGWKDEKLRDRTGSSTRVLGVGHSPSLLLPFGLPEDRKAFEIYWHTILPHSKRYIDIDCVLGTNADVRPPALDERWTGGVMRWGGRRERERDQLDTATLTLDAVLFSTGECVGPDTKQLWDRVIVAEEVHREIAAAARKSMEAGLDAEQTLADVELITGVSGQPIPPPPPPDGQMEPSWFREHELRRFANRIAHMRTHFGNDKTVSILSDWADAAVPQFRRSH
jgi:hypothetical protein